MINRTHTYHFISRPIALVTTITCLAWLCLKPTPTNAETSTAQNQLTAEQYANYLSQLSKVITEKPFSAKDKALIYSQQGPARVAFDKLLTKWLSQEAFFKSAKAMIQTQLSISGKSEGINYDLPGNLFAHLARHDLPYKEVITADYCVDDNGAKIACDTGAFYNAGVLATRAFMASTATRFNLNRATRMMGQFACTHYPLLHSLEPPIEREKLIPMFQVIKAGEGSEDFGNGKACYSCHSQFAAHTQFFVKFDKEGIYIPGAIGLQNPNGQPGESYLNLLTSHFKDLEYAELESSQMLGQPAENLREAAIILTNHPIFWECAVKNTLRFYFNLNKAEVEDLPPAYITSISDDIRRTHSNPSFRELVKGVLGNPRIINATLRE